MCVARILEQWQPLELFFTSEVADGSSVTAERILAALKSPYVKATFEFMSFVLDEVSGLNVLFQSEGFKLHKLYPELLRVSKMFALNFMKISHVRDCQFCALPIDDSSTWNSPEQIYPGLEASDTMKLLLPHQKESFLIRCRDWYREAIKQLYLRFNFNDPVLKAVQFLHPHCGSKSIYICYSFNRHWTSPSYKLSWCCSSTT